MARRGGERPSPQQRMAPPPAFGTVRHSLLASNPGSRMLAPMNLQLFHLLMSSDPDPRPTSWSPLMFGVVGVVAGALVGWSLALAGARRVGLREHVSLDDFGSSYWGPYVKKSPAKYACELGAVFGGIAGFFAGIVTFVLVTQHPWILWSCVAAGCVGGSIISRASRPNRSALSSPDFSQLPIDQQRAIRKSATLDDFVRTLKYSLLGGVLGFPIAYAIFFGLQRAGLL